MADAAAPAVGARPAALELGSLAVGLAAAAGLAALAAADGGYFAPSWGWTALVGLWIAVAWLLLDRVRLAAGALGTAFLAGFLGIATWTWLSLLWTDNTVQTVVEGFRVLAYVGVAAAMFLVVRRETAPALIRGTFAAITLVSLYALATRLFPDRLGTYDPVAEYRLSEPLGYWNGLGIFAAMGALLGLGIVARDSSLLSRCLAAAAFPGLACTIFFTFSRGAWIALGLGFLVAFVLAPRRLHLVVAAIFVGVPAALAVGAAWSAEALTTRNSPLSAAVDQGRVVALIVAVCGVTAAAAVAALAIAEHRIQPARSLRLAFATLLALAAVGALGGVLVNFGGPVALVEDAYDSFRTPPEPPPTNLERRLFTFSGAYRAENWEAAWDDFRANPVVGSGAGTYEQYWNRNRTISHVVRDAHSLYAETLAELGVVGLFFVLLAFGSPAIAAFGARREPLAVGVIGAYSAYVLHAAVDWDWELTGLTAAALACGVTLLAMRGPRVATLVPGTRLRIGAAAVAIALAGVAFVGLIGSSASTASEEALESSSPDYAEAKDEARKAERWAPWSSEPWQRLGEAQLAEGDGAAARTSFRKAIAEEPTDWELWFRLAEASSGAAQRRALAQAERLNPRSPELATFRAELD